MTLVIRFRIRFFALPFIAKEMLAEDFRLLRTGKVHARHLRLKVLCCRLQGRNPVLERKLLDLQNRNTAMQAAVIRLKTTNILADVLVHFLEKRIEFLVGLKSVH